MKLAIAVIFLFTAATAGDQTSMSTRPTTDQAKIADALRAGPPFITKNATLLDWSATPDGEYRLLRKGTNEWTCLPGVPGYPHDEPGCFDPVFMQFLKDGLAGRESRIDKIGVAYMYVGAWVPNKSGKNNGAKNDDFHVGPHVMVVCPHQNQTEMQSLNQDGSNGMPYVNHLPKNSDLFVVLPFRQWDEK
jgi:hypothetical protein